MTPRKPYFFNVSLCFSLCILAFEMSQPSSTGFVGIDIVGGSTARHFMALDAFFVITVFWAVPWTRKETTSLRNWWTIISFREEKRNIYPHAMFIERQSVTEIFDTIICFSEWQSTRYQSHWINGIPDIICAISTRIFKLIWKTPIKNTDHTPTNSISTLIEKARLKSLLCVQPSSLSVIYILYAKGTCWWLHTGKRPTYAIW